MYRKVRYSGSMMVRLKTGVETAAKCELAKGIVCILSLIILIECVYFCVRKVRYSEVHHPESCFCPPVRLLLTSSLLAGFACLGGRAHRPPHREAHGNYNNERRSRSSNNERCEPRRAAADCRELGRQRDGPSPRLCSEQSDMATVYACASQTDSRP